jgi:hypothetical protein
MLPTMLALAFLAPAPVQDNNLPPLLPGYLLHQRRLSTLHWLFCKTWQQHEANSQSCIQRWQDAYRQDAGLWEQAVILRQAVDEIDRACMVHADITRQWEKEYHGNPCPDVRSGFYAPHQEIFHKRAGARALSYYVFLNHKWSWEGEDDHFNNDCLDAVAHLLGYRQSDCLCQDAAWIETALTDLWPYLRR